MKQVTQKTLLMGLSNSGKTSILQYIQGIRNLPAYGETKPTVHINYVLYQAAEGENIIWDFGGQLEYLDGYLEKFYDYIVEANKLIFVIDIQDEEKYEPSLEYLQKIIFLLTKHPVKIEISVFLHKYDPDLHQTHPLITKEKINDLTRKIGNLFPKGMKYKISKTALYTKFKEIPSKF